MILLLSRYPSTSALIMSLNTLDVMAGIAGRTDNDDERRNVAICTIAFLVGKEESTSSLARYMDVVPDSVERLLETLRIMVVDKACDGVAGGFNIRTIMSAFLQLSMSDSNKVKIGTASFLHSAVIVLMQYISNGDNISGRSGSDVANYGGGGNDIEAAELTIEMLTQLSFRYEDKEELHIILILTEIA